MTINDIYQLAIKMGIKADPRGKAGVEKILKRRQQEYQKLSPEKKAEFDKENLRHPYTDTRILFGNPKKTVKKVLAGIDIDGEELLLAERLGSIDLIISHHPRGKALAGLYEVLDLQIDMLAQYGVPINIAEGLLKERIAEIKRKIYPINHQRVVDTAKLLKLPLLCVHTPTDNLVYQFLTSLFEKKETETVSGVVEILKKIPEYQKAIQEKAGPTIAVGEAKNRCGRVVAAEVTGGTEGAKKIYQHLAQAGIGTVIAMHQSEEHHQEAKKYHLNIVIAGHMASDSLGFNLFLDQLETKGIKIIPCSGLIRIARNNKNILPKH